MKIYLLVASLLMLFLSNLFGEIKNGYEKSVPGLMLSLQRLRTILHCDPYLSRAERKDIKRKITLIINHLAYNQATDKLLTQFRMIAPDLYSEIDTLRDARRQAVDVYVKYIPKSQALFKVVGMSSLTPAPNDVNRCISEYGQGSVSIIISDLTRGLRVLSHEFGHVKYVVPNIKSYVEFFRLRYDTGSSEIVLGHSFGDGSGDSAFLFERRFGRRYAQYLKEEPGSSKSLMIHVNPIKRDLLAKLPGIPNERVLIAKIDR